jgi:hypothetical protein
MCICLFLSDDGMGKYFTMLCSMFFTCQEMVLVPVCLGRKGMDKIKGKPARRVKLCEC